MENANLCKRVTTHTIQEQLLSAGDGSGGSVFHEASIARLLTRQRNTIQGGLLRATGA